MKQLLTIVLFLASIPILAQTLYTRTDTLTITGDTVTLQADKFRGTIQWQHSLDGQTWENLAGETDTLLPISAKNEGFYRAEVTDETCNPVYSDTAVIVAIKSANQNIISPGEVTGATFIERNDSVFTYFAPQGISNMPLSTAIIDDKQESDIRVVSGITQNGDTLLVNTRQGTLEDIFFNTEFKLSTQTVASVEKSAYLSTSALARAMVDEKGYIHPVEVIDNNEQNNTLKSARTTDESLPGIYFRKDFSGETIWEEGGASISFDQAYYQLGTELEYEFKFEQQGFDWANKQFPKGKITKFKICTNKEASGIEAKMILKATTSHEFSEEDSKVIQKDVFNKTFKYLIFVPASPIPIPFWATVKVDLMRGSSSTISGEASVTGGATGNFNLELGASFENGSWTTIKPALTPAFTLEGPEVDAAVNVKAQVEVYPHIEVSFYSVLAPYLDVAPYIRSEMEYSLLKNFKYDLYSGVNARLGIKADVFGNNIFDYNTGDLNMFEESLYTAPEKVQVVSGANQKGTAGKPLPEPIVIKVLDSKDNPVKKAIVNFKASMGKLMDALLSSPENQGTKSASLLASATNSTQLAIASDTTGQVKINWTLPDSSFSHKLETFLMDGKDSIREDTRDTISAETCGCDTTKFGQFTDSRDGHVYKTIKIGTQTWMAENLAYLPYKTDTSKWSYTEPCYYVNSKANYTVLYNWIAAERTCPLSWHLPSDFEWSLLLKNLGGKSLAGGKMKSIAGWNSPNTGTNESCFSALATGYYSGGFENPGHYGNVGCGAYWWSNLSYDLEHYDAWSYSLYQGSNIERIPYSTSSGFSIRCVKDDVPTLNTTEISSITTNTAIGGGNVLNDGGKTVTSRGVCWNTTGTPTITDSKTTDGSGTGTFTSTLTGLTPCTTYYVRAYATNSEGTAYGEQVTFTTLGDKLPCLKTKEVTAITNRTASCGGEITNEGDSPVTIRGICWNKTGTPTIADLITNNGGGTGNFTSNMTALNTNTKYYVRAYATNARGTAYGNEITFTTLEQAVTPEATTAGVTDITSNSATCGGTVIKSNGSEITGRGVCWNTTGNPTTDDAKTADGNEMGSFKSKITGLKAGTRYFVRAYATNANGTGYGPQIEFTTDKE